MVPVLPSQASRTVPRLSRAVAAGLVATGGGALLFQIWPQLRTDLFAVAAARLAASLTGAGFERGEAASLVLLGDRTVAVTAACSGTDFFLMVAALIGWRLCRDDRSFLRVVLASISLALPVTLLVNALRIVAVTQAHGWLIPLLPAHYSAYVHMATGAAIFLPSLIVLNFALEMYANRHRPAE